MQHNKHTAKLFIMKFFHQLCPSFRQLLTNRDISWIRKGRLYSSCVRSSMLHGSETWPVRKENEVAFQWVEMKMGLYLLHYTSIWPFSHTPIPLSAFYLGLYLLHYTSIWPSKKLREVWACVAKRRHVLGKEMYGVWSTGLTCPCGPVSKTLGRHMQ